MKITIISYDNWGLNEHLKNALEENGHTVRHINFFNFKHKYPNFRSKLYNFILKTVFNKNIKDFYYGNEIIKKLKENSETQDIILTIKGEFIDTKSILNFKKFTKKSIVLFPAFHIGMDRQLYGLTLYTMMLFIVTVDSMLAENKNIPVTIER